MLTRTLRLSIVLSTLFAIHWATGWEEKNEVYSYPLVELAKNKAVFKRPDQATLVTFQRTSADSLVVVLERMKEGKMSAEEFKYQRAQ
jgi:hypothetical protein